jgi:hypothetical protein
MCGTHSQMGRVWVETKQKRVRRGPTHQLEIISNIYVEGDVRMRRGDVSL